MYLELWYVILNKRTPNSLKKKGPEFFFFFLLLISSTFKTFFLVATTPICIQMLALCIQLLLLVYSSCAVDILGGANSWSYLCVPVPHLCAESCTIQIQKSLWVRPHMKCPNLIKLVARSLHRQVFLYTITTGIIVTVFDNVWLITAVKGMWINKCTISNSSSLYKLLSKKEKKTFFRYKHATYIMLLHAYISIEMMKLATTPRTYYKVTTPDSDTLRIEYGFYY